MERKEISIQGELSRRRIMHLKEQAERQEAVYAAVPAIKECQDEITALALEGARARLFGQPEKEAQAQQKRALLHEKLRTLLSANGYPADYLELQVTCEKCRDEGVYEGRVCSCVRQIQIENRLARSHMNLPETDSFAHFRADLYREMPHPEGKPSAYDNILDKLEKARKFVEDFGSAYDNLLIYGETGLGKTYLTNCIAREILEKGCTVLYLSANTLFDKVLSYRRAGEDDPEKELKDFVYTSDLLILDDLGTETLSEYIRSRLFEVINQRILDRKPVIISTNLDLPGISDRYTERVASRIIEHYQLFYLYGANIRYAKRRALLKKQKPDG